MAYFYSVENDGFYDDTSGIPVPPNAIELTAEKYHSLLQTLNSENKRLILKNGELMPVAREVVITWDMIRAKRNRLLKNSDFIVMPDYPSDKEAWTKYRQALRDLPATFTNPTDVVWPTEPSR